MEELEKAMRDTTALVSVMTVNNEIGVVQPIKEIGQMCRKRKVGLNRNKRYCMSVTVTYYFSLRSSCTLTRLRPSARSPWT